MSLEAFKWARAEILLPSSDLRSSEAFVLWALGDFYSEEMGRAWPSLATLARITRSDRSTVKRAVRSLEDRGLVTVEKWRERDSRRQLTNRFLLPRHRPDVPCARAVVKVFKHHGRNVEWNDCIQVPGTDWFVDSSALR